MSGENRPSELTREEAINIVLEELANLTSKGNDAVFPENKGSNRIRIQPQQRIEKYQKIVELINSYDLPEDKVDEQLLYLGWNEGTLFFGDYLRDNFFYTNGLPNLCRTRPPSRYDAFDELNQLFPEIRTLLTDNLNKTAETLTFPSNATKNYDLNFEALLLAEALGTDLMTQKKYAEVIVHNALINGVSKFGLSPSADDFNSRIINISSEKYNIFPEEMNILAQNAINLLANYNDPRQIDCLANVEQSISSFADIKSFDWSKFSINKVLKNTKENIENHLRGNIYTRHDIETIISVLDHIYIPEIKSLFEIPFLNKKIIGSFLIKNLNIYNVNLKHDVITKIASVCLTEKEAKNIISKYILNYLRSNKFGLDDNDRLCLSKWANEIGNSKLAEDIEKDNYKYLKKAPNRKQLLSLKDEAKKAERLETAHKLLAKN